MATTKCRDCGAQRSYSAYFCPRCGAPTENEYQRQNKEARRRESEEDKEDRRREREEDRRREEEEYRRWAQEMAHRRDEEDYADYEENSIVIEIDGRGDDDPITIEITTEQQEKYYDRCIAQKPNDPEPILDKCLWCLMTFEDLNGAYSLARQALHLSQNWQTLWYAGFLARANSDYTTAYKFLISAFALSKSINDLNAMAAVAADIGLTIVFSRENGGITDQLYEELISIGDHSHPHLYLSEAVELYADYDRDDAKCEAERCLARAQSISYLIDNIWLFSLVIELNDEVHNDCILDDEERHYLIHRLAKICE